MKMRKISLFLLSLCLVISMLTGCGSSSKSQNYSVVSPGAPMMESAAADAVYGNGAAKDGGTVGNAAASLPQGRKWVITQDISVETEDLDSLMQALTQSVTDLGGYIESQYTNNGSNYSGRRYRNASMTIRIPSEKLDGFIQTVGENGNVTRSSRNAEDITLNYVDTQGRITALETEEARLLELMAKAETMADLLEIQGRLTDVQYRLESYSSQLRTMDNQVDYATVNMDLEEVTEYTPVEEPSFAQRIVTGFRDNLAGLWAFLQDLLVLVITNLPALLLLGGVIWGFIALCIRSSKKRKAKRVDIQTSKKQDAGAQEKNPEE